MTRTLHEAILYRLLDAKAQSKLSNADGETALSFAEAEGHDDIVEALGGRPVTPSPSKRIAPMLST